MELKGKNVFITGSTRGIGQALALAFAQAGANIVLNGRKEISKEQVEAIIKYDVKCLAVTGDIADYDAVTAMLQMIESEFGQIHILINNAGITNDKLLVRMTQEDFQKCLDINLVGTFNVTQQVLKKMFTSREGRIINLTSVVGLTGNVGQANYAASKAGVVGFTKSVAREAALRGITCNAIAPGFIETEMTEKLSDKVKEQTKKQIPLQRYGQVADVAQAAIFLASSPYITGQVINVDGGMVMQG